MGGLIIVVWARLAGERLGEARRIRRTDRIDALVLALTFIATTEFALQYALVLGIALTWAVSAVRALRAGRRSPLAFPRPFPRSPR